MGTEYGWLGYVLNEVAGVPWHQVKHMCCPLHRPHTYWKEASGQGNLSLDSDSATTLPRTEFVSLSILITEVQKHLLNLPVLLSSVAVLDSV